MVKRLPEFEYFYCILEKIEHLFQKLKYPKVTDYAALTDTLYIIRIFTCT